MDRPAEVKGSQREAKACPVMVSEYRGSSFDLSSAPARSPSWALCLFCAVASSVLLWLSFFPVAASALAWVGLAPLFFLVRARGSRRRIFASAWLSGLIFFWASLQWMRVADYRMYATWITLATTCAFFVPAAIFLLRRLDRWTTLPLVITAPVVWVLLDYIRTHLMTGFPWYFLAHSQHDFLLLTQIADLTGAYGVTFIVVAVNALIFEVLVRLQSMRRLFDLPLAVGRTASGPIYVHALFVAALFAGALGYGALRLRVEDFQPGPRVALIQGNLDQRLRNDATVADDDEAARAMLKHYADLSDLAMRQASKPELIIWPETSFPDPWLESPGKDSAKWREQIVQWANRSWATNVLLGLNVTVEDANGDRRRYNSALLIRPNGTVGGRYDKIHRVPFGEYVPLRDWLPFMNALAPYDFDYSIQPGESRTSFFLGQLFCFGVLICYEDTDPTLGRAYVHPTRGSVDFLVNISNDGWFDGTSEHEEHLAICRFRAIECRRAIVRAVNMGVSAFIDGSGRVLRPREAILTKEIGASHVWEIDDSGSEPLPVAQWRQFKKTAGVLSGVIPIDRRLSFYSLWGDWFCWGCLLVLLGGMVWSFPRSSRAGGGWIT